MRAINPLSHGIILPFTNNDPLYHEIVLFFIFIYPYFLADGSPCGAETTRSILDTSPSNKMQARLIKY
jgi:hypothetical protein